MGKRNLGLIVFLVFIIVLVGCSKGSEKIESISVYKMNHFSTVQEDTLTMFTDVNVISEFTNAFKNAKKEPGIVNMTDPEYKVEIGEEEYFLWVNEGYGTIMNINDTNTIYTLSKSSAKRIDEWLN